MLIDASADVNKCLPNGRSTLHTAAKHNNPTGIEMLIMAGAKVEHRDKSGNTALDLAQRYNHFGCVVALQSQFNPVRDEA